MKSENVPNAEFIERCQIEYDRNPSSRVFAPLCEAYRRLGLIPEALEIASRGVRLHPDFAAGRIAFARILIEKKAFPDAIEQLKKAAELSPDNILAVQLLGDTYLELRRPKDALGAFKMVLFLNPLHERAKAMVRKWEFLTADEFEDVDFEWTSSEALDTPPVDIEERQALQQNPTRADREAYRAISIADALTVRNDLEAALATLGRGLRKLGPRPDLEQRLGLLGRRLGLTPEAVQRLARESAGTPEASSPSVTAAPARPTAPPVDKKKQKLESILKRLKSREAQS